MNKAGNRPKLVAMGVLLAVLLSACFPRVQQPSPTTDLDALFTEVAGTLSAHGTSSPELIDAVTATPDPLIATRTSVAFQTATNTPGAFPTATRTVPSFTPQSGSGGSGGTGILPKVCNQAQLVSQKLSPNLLAYASGQKFTVTWTLKNVGTCTWTSKYTVVFSSGTDMADKKSYALPGKVSPGQSVEISIVMHAPAKTGDVTSNWLLRSDSGQTFGLGGTTPLSVKIKASAQIKTSYRYDFATNACNAAWESKTGSLPCPGTVGGTKGFVVFTLNPVLETRHEDEPALWVRPNHASNGYIRGVYPFFEVASGDRFFAVIGCHGDRTKCNVHFSLNYINQNGVEKSVAFWDEKSDGNVTTVNVDLSFLAGKKVRFVLTVEPNNSTFDQADAIWFLPSIRTSPAPTATNTSAPTDTPTPTDTATATDTPTATQTPTDTSTP